MENIQLPVLETKRLTLRAIELKDRDDMYDYAKRENVGPMAGWFPHKNKMESQAIIQSMRENTLTEKNIGVFSIIYQGKMIGTIGLHKYHEKNSTCEMGYVLSPDYWGKGIICEASQRLISWLFDDFGLYRLECGHYDFNTQSKRVIEKLGFTFEGISRKKIVLINGNRCDLLHYSILKEEFTNKKLSWK